MLNKTTAIGLVILTGIFIAVGDRLLPDPLADYSLTARSTLLDMLPKLRRQNYNQKTEEAVDQLHNP
ncbi:hypothetical protein [Lyngbya confervoides]|uniref:Uncharacterized protein n=1 Tax=Lyngbya confervoides BDU141951 TaxID=1574623 RepID=A0ABD4SZR5_9CYAN|nr:hypothetical protein [Lyngbya confervoides]MCM1981916.1 hypothetical protein [Lyngbya confervoides BDU141951]